jgi:nicotinamidase-related amidase
MPDRYNLRGKHEPQSSVVLLLIDVINDMEFEGGDKLLRQARPMAGALSRLRSRAKAAGIPVIYVNDNCGQWRSDFRKTIAHCLDDGVRGEPIARLLLPDDDDYFVLKPKSSAFFDTTLQTLLQHLGAEHLILTGVAADVCILFSANDAHLRDYRIIVPSDCVASNTRRETEQALRNLVKTTQTRVVVSSRLDLKSLSGRPPKSRRSRKSKRTG